MPKANSSMRCIESLSHENRRLKQGQLRQQQPREPSTTCKTHEMPSKPPEEITELEQLAQTC